MRDLQQASAKRQVKLQLISFSVDPEYDTPAVLAGYAKQHEVDLASWSFLTGDIEVVRKTAVDGFKLAFDGEAQPGAEHFGIVHGSHLVLVDTELQIRGYYRTSDDDEMRKLVVDAPALA